MGQNKWMADEKLAISWMVSRKRDLVQTSVETAEPGKISQSLYSSYGYPDGS